MDRMARGQPSDGQRLGKGGRGGRAPGLTGGPGATPVYRGVIRHPLRSILRHISATFTALLPVPVEAFTTSVLRRFLEECRIEVGRRPGAAPPGHAALGLGGRRVRRGKAEATSSARPDAHAAGAARPALRSARAVFTHPAGMARGPRGGGWLYPGWPSPADQPSAPARPPPRPSRAPAPAPAPALPPVSARAPARAPRPPAPRPPAPRAARPAPREPPRRDAPQGPDNAGPPAVPRCPPRSVRRPRAPLFPPARLRQSGRRPGGAGGARGRAGGDGRGGGAGVADGAVGRGRGGGGGLRRRGRGGGARGRAQAGGLLRGDVGGACRAFRAHQGCP